VFDISLPSLDIFSGPTRNPSLSYVGLGDRDFFSCSNCPRLAPGIENGRARPIFPIHTGISEPPGVTSWLQQSFKEHLSKESVVQGVSCPRIQLSKVLLSNYKVVQGEYCPIRLLSKEVISSKKLYPIRKYCISWL